MSINTGQSVWYGGGDSLYDSQHFIDNCPERTKPPEGYLCRICNIPGHLVRDCPTKHAVGDTGGRKPRQGYVCRACGSELHYIADCPVANQEPHGQGGKRRPPKEIGRMPFVLFAFVSSFIMFIQRRSVGSVCQTRTWRKWPQRQPTSFLMHRQETLDRLNWYRVLLNVPERADYPNTVGPRRK